MGWLFSLLIAVAIAVSIARRVKQLANRLADPARLQRAFGEAAAIALRRAGADPRSVARLETFEREPEPSAPHRHIGALQRPARPRPRMRMNRSGPIDFELGDRFRLSEPPENGEPHDLLRFDAGWIAIAVLVGGAAYYLIR